MLVQITVGYVAGFIAAAIFVARLWSPNVLTFILSGVLRDSNSAATWTAASTALQRSNWPWILQSDSVRNHGVRKSILSLTWIISFMSFMIAIAGVVTPLGLYEALVPDDNTETPFKYLKDTSPFGFGTPPRSNYSENRVCTDQFLPIPCPFTSTVTVALRNSTGLNYDYPYGYDIEIPQMLEEIYSSGVGNATTISNYFDIQWRRYTTTYDKVRKMYNNGSTYLVGSMRMMQSLALEEAVKPIEGLIVDTKNGGIGFRNHTVPPGYKHGVTWEEDLLFVEPETVCVDTNTTIDYEIAATVNSSYSVINLVITDRGGFANLKQEYPRIDLTDTQRNPKLWERAYKAAWMTNAYTMLFFNVTNPTNETSGQKAFEYLNSEVGKDFGLELISGGYAAGSSYDSLSLNHDFDGHLKLEGSYIGSYNASGRPKAPNPFHIQRANFSDISLICSGAGNTDFANITNIVVNCGLLRGIPQRKNEGSSIIFDAGSKWSQPIYACASAVKAKVKNVCFTYNGTEELKSLVVDKVEDKIYPDNSSKPLWGVEYSGNKYIMSGINLMWGMVSSEYEGHPNVSTIRQEHLYLPGYAAEGALPLQAIMSQNLPASEFYTGALGNTYSVGSGSSALSSIGPTTADYSGQSNMALWAKWQTLGQDIRNVSQIPNIIFTDYAAAAVVGTKGVLGPGNAAQRNIVPISITPTVSRIRYHLPFAVPAIIVLIGLILMTLAALVTMIFHHHNIHKMRLQLQKLSPGRIFTTFLHPDLGGMSVSSKVWSRNAGRVEIDVSGDYPFSAKGMHVPADANDGMRFSRGEKAVVVQGREVSSERGTERDQFLGQPSPMGHPAPYNGVDVPPVSYVPTGPRY